MVSEEVMRDVQSVSVKVLKSSIAAWNCSIAASSSPPSMRISPHVLRSTATVSASFASRPRAWTRCRAFVTVGPYLLYVARSSSWVKSGLFLKLLSCWFLISSSSSHTVRVWKASLATSKSRACARFLTASPTLPCAACTLPSEPSAPARSGLSPPTVRSKTPTAERMCFSASTYSPRCSCACPTDMCALATRELSTNVPVAWHAFSYISRLW
mmetsp:Transcript_6593/g.17875  ORF Transcript_6593/g.17875 Transcript_6593/m.17875 type:complete len:213 (-) Transcript_6593:320-958(-)